MTGRAGVCERLREKGLEKSTLKRLAKETTSCFLPALAHTERHRVDPLKGRRGKGLL